jgi:Flp pilus assembly protein TadB
VLIWIVAALATVFGVPWIALGALALIAVAPIPGVILLALVSVGHTVVARSKRATANTETALLRSLAASVTAGLTLREAIATSSADLVSLRARRLCVAGASMAEVGAVFGSELPVNGARLASLCAMSELTGAPVGDAMKAAAERSERSAASRRKRRSALAQVRFSAWVVGVAPLVLTLLVVLTRGIPQPRGAIIVIPMVVGFVLQVTGTATVFVLSGRAS